MGKKENKFFSVNMNTEEPEKEVSSTNTSKTSHSINTSQSNGTVSSNIKESPVRHISFNQKDVSSRVMPEHHVRRIENADELFGTKKEKVKPKDLKLVLVPAIVLIIFCILNEIFVLPIVIDKVCEYVLHGELSTISLSGSLSNDELLVIAGLTAIVGYSIFSISLLGFSIYNLFKLIYIKRDIVEKATKILLYAFLIGFAIAAVDAFTKVNISNIIVKITTFGMHSITKFIK